MGRYTKFYKSIIPGRKGARMSEEAFKRLPSIQVNGKTYAKGGLVEVTKGPVKEPEAAKKAKKFGAKEADLIRKKILNNDLKGLTAGVCKAFAEFEGVAPKNADLDQRGWLKLISDHVKSGAKDEAKKEAK